MLKRGLLMIVTLQLQRQRIASSREKFDDDGLHSYYFSSRSGDSKKFSTISFVDEMTLILWRAYVRDRICRTFPTLGHVKSGFDSR